MDSTAQLGLPLIMPAQAQKHVTVNEALTRIDALAQLRVASSTREAPPSPPTPGLVYLVPAGASGEWATRSKQIAIGVDGGWIYATPCAGWRAWDEELKATMTFDGVDWIADAIAVSPCGAATRAFVASFDHEIFPGPHNETEFRIRANQQVIGVTGRVTAALVGSGLNSWRLGTPGAEDRYGSGLGILAQAYVHGLTGSPVTYYSDTPLLIAGDGGPLQSGRVRLCVHCIALELPR